MSLKEDLSALYLCSWGNLLLFASKLDWEAGNTQVVHDLAQGDDHPVQSRGAHLGRVSATLMFDDFVGVDETGVAAWRRFEATKGQRELFTHPISGSFWAKIGDLKPTIDESTVITAVCEFIPDEPVQPVSPAGAGASGTAGELAVSAAADKLAKTLSDQGIGFPPEKLQKMDFSKSIDTSIDVAFTADVNVTASFSSNVSAGASGSASASASASATATATATVQASATASVFAFARAYADASATATVSAVAEISGMAGAGAFSFAYACAALDADVRASVESWTDQEVTPTSKILTDTARLSDSIATMIEVGELEDNLQLWPVFRDAILLGESIRTAAISATSETPSVFVMRVQTRVSLLRICGQTYGGAEAQSRARQVASLNDIRTQGWLDPGDYLMPARRGAALSPLLDQG
jgi:hypothetical protein